jgi:hypothetical protein
MFHAADKTNSKIDPMLTRTLVFALEQITRTVLEQGDEGRRVTEASIARARAVMMRIATASIAGSGARLTPIPTVD